MSLLRPSAFDAECFGVPWYRVHGEALDGLEAELSALLGGAGPYVVDTKRPAADVTAAHRLLRAGFRKVCMQVALAAPPAEGPADEEGVSIAPQLDLSEALRAAHARNFRYDRFSLDPDLPEAGRVALYRRWITSSLSGARRVAHLDDGFVTFDVRGDRLVIDLLSVLTPRRGTGARLIRALRRHAGGLGLGGVDVVTECENAPACALYAAGGFLPLRYVAAYHLVRGA